MSTSGIPGWGVRTGAAEAASQIISGRKPRGPEWVGWRMKYSNLMNPNVQLPVDDPWTYKNKEQYELYHPWKDWNPNPDSDSDWRQLTRDMRYTKYHAINNLTQNHATKVIAGREVKSKNDARWDRMTKAKHDLTKPLGLMQKQRNMVNDHAAGLLETSATAAAKDKFLAPNPIRRTAQDGSAASARTRMKAMQQFRALRPDAMLRVAKDVMLRHHPELAARAEAFPNRVDFATFLDALHPPSTYYKLGGEDVPADQRVTSSTRFPLGYAHTGSVSAYGGGTWATGS
eukprot:TRINITY_DN30005_c0_g1_i1.p1 TRINITY_DN30005_c0_g1~~TRINITY_DN30005_c0_g1_i1.p1  ORF type:complete len:310 (+),score=108.72 TRINITY_DN30005_c0_g1_i1:70-930(+)